MNRLCPRCGGSNPPAFTFCGFCGAPLQAHYYRSKPSSGFNEIYKSLISGITRMQGYGLLPKNIDPRTMLIAAGVGLFGILILFGALIEQEEKRKKVAITAESTATTATPSPSPTPAPLGLTANTANSTNGPINSSNAIRNRTGGTAGSSGSDYYINSEGESVRRPTFSKTAPAGASARCRDGSYSFSRNRRGTCSHHGGVAEWL